MRERGSTVWLKGRAKWQVLLGISLVAVMAVGSSSSSGAASSTGSRSRAASDSLEASGSSTAACVSTAEQYVRKNGQIPTTLGQGYAALPSKPKPGGTIIDVTDGQIPTNTVSADSLETAAKSAGWKGEVLDFDGSVQDLNAKWEEAIADKPTAIISDGYPAAALATPLAQAKAAGIIAILGSVADSPVSVPGFAGVSNGSAIYKTLGELEAYLFMKESGCKGQVAVFNLAGFPVLEVDTNEFKSVITEHCPLCKVTYAASQPSDIGTPAGTDQIVSLLQANTAIKYVYTTVSDTVDGLVSALNSAGISGMQIFGNTPDSNAIAALQNRTNAWWLSQSPQINGWMEAYLALKIKETGKTFQLPTEPVGVITPGNVSHTSTAIPTYPTNYEELFKKLWHAG
jgi:ABC-type sugar transport system substrate-binding protein